MYGQSTYGVGVYGSGATYSFYASGMGTPYGPFTGGHDVKLAEDFPEEGTRGLLVVSTGQTERWEGSLSSTLPTVKLAEQEKDPAVLGVFVGETDLPAGHWYEKKEGERFATVNALGDGRMWVTDINGEINNGDYVTTSPIPGYGQKQDDNLLYNYTAAKVTESVNWDKVEDTVLYQGKLYKAYLIAVTYHSG